MTTEPPYESYDMQEYGQTVVESLTAGHLLAGLVGRRITRATTLVWADDQNAEAGLVLYLDSGGALAVLNDVDQLDVYEWPSLIITSLGYVERQS